MKTLFIVLSIFAISYLALQTSFVKEILTGVSQQLEITQVKLQEDSLAQAESLQQEEKHQEHDRDANIDKNVLAKLNKLTQQSIDEQIGFEERINALEKNIETLKNIVQSDAENKEPTRNIDFGNRLEKTNPNALKNPSESQLQVAIEANLPQAQEAIEAMASIDSNVQASVTQASNAQVANKTMLGNEKTQQQKRQQQQAVLRALSQKMELAALSSLVN